MRLRLLRVLTLCCAASSCAAGVDVHAFPNAPTVLLGDEDGELVVFQYVDPLGTSLAEPNPRPYVGNPSLVAVTREGTNARLLARGTGETFLYPGGSPTSDRKFLVRAIDPCAPLSLTNGRNVRDTLYHVRGLCTMRRVLRAFPDSGLWSLSISAGRSLHPAPFVDFDFSWDTNVVAGTQLKVRALAPQGGGELRLYHPDSLKAVIVPLARRVGFELQVELAPTTSDCSTIFLALPVSYRGDLESCAANAQGQRQEFKFNLASNASASISVTSADFSPCIQASERSGSGHAESAIGGPLCADGTSGSVELIVAAQPRSRRIRIAVSRRQPPGTRSGFSVVFAPPNFVR